MVWVTLGPTCGWILPTPVQITAGRLRGRVRVRVRIARGGGHLGGERELEVERDPEDRLREELAGPDRTAGTWRR